MRGVALGLTADVGIVDGDQPGDVRTVDARHPADIAFRRGGGEGAFWVRSPIPMARGLGYSGAMRIGEQALAASQRAGAPIELEVVAPVLLEHAVALEGPCRQRRRIAVRRVGGHRGEPGLRVSLGLTPAVVVSIPPQETSTQRSRHALPGSVSFGDATFNVGRTALLVAALAAGDVDALRWATANRLHQDGRLAAAPTSRHALAAGH